MRSEIRRDPLRGWWITPALVVVMMIGTWAYAERPVIGRDGDMRFLVRPDAELAPRQSESEDAWLRLDWTSRHDGDVRYRELDVLLDGTLLRYVGHDPGPGEWSALRDGVYLSAAERSKDDDIIAIGSERTLDGARIQFVVDPCDCTASRITLR